MSLIDEDFNVVRMHRLNRDSLENRDLDAAVMTVTGAISARHLGATLPHEHVLLDFVGAEKVSRERYDQDEAFEVILPHLKRVRELACQSLAECTPACRGSDPGLLRRPWYSVADQD